VECVLIDNLIVKKHGILPWKFRKFVPMETTQKSHIHPDPAVTSAGVNGAHAIESPLEQFIDDELLHAHHHGLQETLHDAMHALPWSARGSQESGPLPLIMGVTGHRDLRQEDIPKIKELVLEEFSYLRSTFPATPITLLTALADGADRLLAHIALDRGMRLAVVLPMPVDMYETDFEEGSRAEFHALLDKAEYLTELPILFGRTREELREHGFPREEQYAQVGAYLASHSAILIALWDGVELNKVGGTSQVVKFKLDGIPEPYALPHSQLDAPDSGPVYHIITPRRSNPHPANAFSVHRLYPAGFRSHAEAEKAYADVYSRMETFNKDAIKYSVDLKEHFRASKEYMFPTHVHHLVGHHRRKKHHHHIAERQGTANHPEALPPLLKEDLDFYAIADVLSQRFQKRTKTTIQLLLTFVFFAAFFYELYSGLFQEPAMLGLYLGMFLFSFIVYYWAERHAYQTRYLDYRALAEGLRVQFFWKLAGVEDSVADFYMRKQKSELDWIRNAIRTCTIESSKPNAETPIAEDAERERLKLVLKHWVEDQAKYFAKTAHRAHETMHGHERTITMLFAGALVLAAVQAFAFREHNELLLLGIGVFPVLAAVLHSYLQKNAFAEHKRQYDRMSVFYHRATVHLTKLITEDRLADARAFLAELGREALAENGDWILMHRDRPLEVPKGA
jgi:hypothetical protein